MFLVVLFASSHIYVCFYQTKTENFSGKLAAFVVYFIQMMSSSSWLSANKIQSSSHIQNTTILDCLNNYKHCKIYLVISTFANEKAIEKVLTTEVAPFIYYRSIFLRFEQFERLLETFCRFETRLSQQARSFVDNKNCPWACNTRKSCLVSSQSNCAIHQNKCLPYNKYLSFIDPERGGSQISYIHQIVHIIILQFKS